jgi:hypothetical protein
MLIVAKANGLIVQAGWTEVFDRFALKSLDPALIIVPLEYVKATVRDHSGCPTIF